MIVFNIFNIPEASNNYNSYDAIIHYLGKRDGIYGDWSIRTKDHTDKASLDKEIKQLIKKYPATYEVVTNKLIWKNKRDHDIYNKIYCDPITGAFVMPSADNVWKANEVYRYAIAGDKAKHIF